MVFDAELRMHLFIAVQGGILMSTSGTVPRDRSLFQVRPPLTPLTVGHILKHSNQETSNQQAPKKIIATTTVIVIDVDQPPAAPPAHKRKHWASHGNPAPATPCISCSTSPALPGRPRPYPTAWRSPRGQQVAAGYQVRPGWVVS